MKEKPVCLNNYPIVQHLENDSRLPRQSDATVYIRVF